MFSRDDRGDDIFTSSTYDSSKDKIIIREKSQKKVRRRVKKSPKDKPDKIKIVKDMPKGPAINSPDDYYSYKESSKKQNDVYKLPRMKDIKKDDFEYDATDFRKSSSDWRDSSIPDYSGLDNLSGSSFGGFSSGGGGLISVRIIAAVLAVIIFVSAILTTNVYAKLQCQEKMVTAMSRLTYAEGNESFDMEVAQIEEYEAPVYTEEATPQAGRVLSLVLTSVEKDLKIKLVDDEDDTLVKNIPWSVTVTDGDGNATSEEDDDVDGIIHMTELSAGDYTVELNPSDSLSDYKVPVSAQVVSVKAKVEYKVIADIKEEIKSEKEINAAIEDNGNQAADVETSSPAVNDTVEWVESTKTATGDEYVEATPDLTKTAQAKTDNKLLAVLEKFKTASLANFGGSSIAYPVILADIKDNANIESEHAHDWKYQSNGDGTHTGVCVAAGCSEGTKPGTCDTSGPDGSCSKCDYKAPQAEPTPTDTPAPTPTEAPSEPGEATPTPTPAGTVTPTPTPVPDKIEVLDSHKHSFEYKSNGDGTHTVTCIISDCKGGFETKEACTLNGDTCKLCKGKHTHSYTYKPNGDGTHQATCACGVAIKSEGCVFENDVCVKCKGNKTAESKYSDDAQLYDALKNALYVKEGDTYRLAKYRDYKNNPSQTFYRKQDGFKYTGWQTLDGKTYYYTKENQVVTGDQIIGGVKYHFATDGALSQGSGTLGIDVSKYQPSINWSSVKASGINYVIIRCGYRGSSTGVLVEDPYFKSHIKGAKAAGLKVGIYFFTTAISEAEAVEEASMTAYLCNGYGIDYPVFIDCESSGRAGYNGMSASQRTAIIKAFCNTIRSAGYTPGVYANKTWLSEKMIAGELSGYKIWLAQYNAAGPTYSGRYDLWQYTSKGSVNGISGYVDMNQSYLGY